MLATRNETEVCRQLRAEGYDAKPHPRIRDVVVVRGPVNTQPQVQSRCPRCGPIGVPLYRHTCV